MFCTNTSQLLTCHYRDVLHLGKSSLFSRVFCNVVFGTSLLYIVPNETIPIAPSFKEGAFVVPSFCFEECYDLA